MGNSSMSRCVQDGPEVSANASNNASCYLDGMGGYPDPVKDPYGGYAHYGPGSQQNTTGWKFGDPICPFDRDSYTKRVADRLNQNLNAIEKYIKVKVWTEDEKKKVSAGLGGIASNLHENYCLYEKVIEYAIGGPLGRINYKAREENTK